VDGPVKLDDDLEFMTVEIDDVVSDLVLSAKLEPVDLSVLSKTLFGKPFRLNDFRIFGLGDRVPEQAEDVRRGAGCVLAIL